MCIRDRLPTNLKVTPKVYIVRCRREEGIAKSHPNEQELDTKAHAEDEWAESHKVQKGNRNPHV